MDTEPPLLADPVPLRTSTSPPELPVPPIKDSLPPEPSTAFESPARIDTVAPAVPNPDPPDIDTLPAALIVLVPELIAIDPELLRDEPVVNDNDPLVEADSDEPMFIAPLLATADNEAPDSNDTSPPAPDTPVPEFRVRSPPTAPEPDVMLTSEPPTMDEPDEDPDDNTIFPALPREEAPDEISTSPDTPTVSPD